MTDLPRVTAVFAAIQQGKNTTISKQTASKNKMICVEQEQGKYNAKLKKF